MKHWKDYSIQNIEQDISTRKTNISQLQMKRDALQKALFDNPGDDMLLSKILKVNHEIVESRKPLLQRELFLRQGIRRRP